MYIIRKLITHVQVKHDMKSVIYYIRSQFLILPQTHPKHKMFHNL